MLPKCREVAEQLSENIDQPVTGFKRFKLKLHLLLCAYCRRYGKQIELSSDTLNSIDKNNKPKPSDSFKASMISRYKKLFSDSKD